MALATARCGRNPRAAPDAKSSQMFIYRRCLFEPRIAQNCSNSTANGRGVPTQVAAAINLVFGIAVAKVASLGTQYSTCPTGPPPDLAHDRISIMSPEL